jgi:hypothetical protein
MSAQLCFAAPGQTGTIELSTAMKNQHCGWPSFVFTGHHKATQKVFADAKKSRSSLTA